MSFCTQDMDWSCSSSSGDTCDAYEQLLFRMNCPKVVIDNSECDNATIVKVDSANKHGILLEAVQVLTDLHLNVIKAYVSSDGRWFMDVFHVTDQHGNKLTDKGVMAYIEKSLGTNQWVMPSSYGHHRSTVELSGSAVEHTAIELTGTDRPGLLSEIFAVLADLRCNVVEAEVWTHNGRVACLVFVTDQLTGGAVEDPERTSKIEELLKNVLRRDDDIRGARTSVSMSFTHTERRLHQMMFADRDYERPYPGRLMGADSDLDFAGTSVSTPRETKGYVRVDNCFQKGYSVVSISCKDRPKLLFDIVCTLTDMQYVVFHAIVNAQGPETYQEYYIRHTDGCPVNSEAEKRRVIQCLEAAIERRAGQGLRLELCTRDRVGLLSDVTRIFRENGMSVTRAEVSTRGEKAVNVFYVTDTSGNPVDPKTVEAVRREIGLAVLQVKDNSLHTKSPQATEAPSNFFSLGSLFKTKSERFLYHLGLIKSYS